MKTTLLAGAWAAFSLLMATTATARDVISLDREWRFHLGDLGEQSDAATTPDLARSDFDDHPWKSITVPHDYVIEGTFTKGNSSFLQHGALPLEIAWYRRNIDFPAPAVGKIAWLEFDGVYRDSRYWLDGKSIGAHTSGFIGYQIDLGPITASRMSELAVRVDPRNPEGWWYDGGGIYRHARLVLVDPIHVGYQGVRVRATMQNLSDEANATATVQVSTDLVNQTAEPLSVRLVQEVLDDQGRVVANGDLGTDLAVGTANPSQTLSLPKARLWSCDHPTLYTLRTTVRKGEQTLDQVITPFGIRDVHFDPERGLMLNGQHVLIKGVCYHQDAAGTGVAVPDRLLAWRLEQLKKIGINALRFHHAPAPELLDDCDRMGLMVLDEFRQLGSGYGKAKPTSTSDDLENQANQIRRDRNHPSVIMWSLCNEEGAVQGTPDGARLGSALKALVERLDGTRPVTAALIYNAGRSNSQDYFAKTGLAGVVDVIGFNYAVDNWNNVHAAYPTTPCVVTELTRMMNTRGIYAQESFSSQKGDAALGICNQYNETAEQSWKAVASRPWLAGVFVWVGFDFKGEPKPVAWPPVAAQKGLLDSCGFEKDSTWYYKSWWKGEPVIHVFPHWNWQGQEGKPIPVWVYSNAQEVELFLNGKSLGKKAMIPNGHLEWSVPYEPGTLEARGSWGTNMLSDQVVTTGAPARVVLEPDRSTLHADGSDLSVITVNIVDSAGHLVPTANDLVRFTVTGAGSVLGVGNGNPASHEPDKASQRSAFAGLCQLLVQASDKPGEIKVQAESSGLESTSIKLVAR